MSTWFEVKIRYGKTAENGLTRMVTEPYLIDAMSFTESEGKCVEEMTPFISGDFVISNIKRANYSEVFFSQEEKSDRWYKVKMSLILMDEKNGTEKRSQTYVLVQACGLRDAVKKLDENMKESMVDYEIVSVAETGIMDVYIYKSEERDI